MYAYNYEEGKVAYYETGKPKIVVTPKEGVDFPLDEINQELDSYGYDLLEVSEDGSYYMNGKLTTERAAACEIISSYDEVQSIDITCSVIHQPEGFFSLVDIILPNEYSLEEIAAEYPELNIVEKNSLAYVDWDTSYNWDELSEFNFEHNINSFNCTTDIYNAFM